MDTLTRDICTASRRCFSLPYIPKKGDVVFHAHEKQLFAGEIRDMKESVEMATIRYHGSKVSDAPFADILVLTKKTNADAVLKYFDLCLSAINTMNENQKFVKTNVFTPAAVPMSRHCRIVLTPSLVEFIESDTISTFASPTPRDDFSANAFANYLMVLFPARKEILTTLVDYLDEFDADTFVGFFDIEQCKFKKSSRQSKRLNWVHVFHFLGRFHKIWEQHIHEEEAQRFTNEIQYLAPFLHDHICCYNDTLNEEEHMLITPDNLQSDLKPIASEPLSRLPPINTLIDPRKVVLEKTQALHPSIPQMTNEEARQPQIRSLSWVPRKFSLKAEIPKSATTPRMVHMDTLQRKGIGPTLRTWGKMMIPNPVPHHETLFSAAFIMEVNSLRLAKEKQRQDDDAAAELDRAILEKEAHDSKLLQERSRAEKAKRALLGESVDNTPAKKDELSQVQENDKIALLPSVVAESPSLQPSPSTPKNSKAQSVDKKDPVQKNISKKSHKKKVPEEVVGQENEMNIETVAKKSHKKKVPEEVVGKENDMNIEKVAKKSYKKKVKEEVEKVPKKSHKKKVPGEVLEGANVGQIEKVAKKSHKKKIQPPSLRQEHKENGGNPSFVVPKVETEMPMTRSQKRLADKHFILKLVPSPPSPSKPKIENPSVNVSNSIPSTTLPPPPSVPQFAPYIVPQKTFDSLLSVPMLKPSVVPSKSVIPVLNRTKLRSRDNLPAKYTPTVTRMRQRTMAKQAEFPNIDIVSKKSD